MIISEKKYLFSLGRLKRRFGINMNDGFEEKPVYNNADLDENDVNGAFCIFCCETFSESK